MASPSEPAPRRFRVEPEEAGVRLDAFLAARLGVPRTRVRRLLEACAVSVDAHPVSARAKGLALAAGARVDVAAFTPDAELRVAPEPDAPLSVLAEGPGWLAVDKPAGMAVHPLREGERGTLLGAVAARRPEVHGIGEGGLRSGVVHRIDVDASGAVVFATDPEVWRTLRDAFARHRVDKRYRALVLGSLEGPERVELDLVVARHRPALVRVVGPGGDGRSRSRRCVLRWRALERPGGATLVEVRLVTGFLHQIRATFAHLAAPVAGDPVYGPGPEHDPTGAPRLMLHASRVRWGEVRAESPDPDDFRGVLDRLRGARDRNAGRARGGRQRRQRRVGRAPLA